MIKSRAIAMVILFTIFLSQPWSLASQWWAVYVTFPDKRSGFLVEEDPETGLISMIDQTGEYFYGAFYELSEDRIIDALIRAHWRGIDIRIVMDRDNSDNPGVQRLLDAGIDLVTDNRRGFMHNKFAIADGIFVWTGSYNCTRRGNRHNNNNSIKICSRDLADIYLDEFMEMHHDRVFGNRREAGILALLNDRHHVRVEDTDIYAYFAPEDSVEQKIIQRLVNARKSIYFMAFSLTSGPLVDLMVKKHQLGVSVKGIMENRGARGIHSKYRQLIQKGIVVKLDSPTITMHHKVIIIDECIVITGSYNFSKNAEKRNDENILIIDSPSIAKEYLKEFRRLYR